MHSLCIFGSTVMIPAAMSFLALVRACSLLLAMSPVSGCESSTTRLSCSLSAVATAETPTAFASSNTFIATAETAASVETPALETPAVETVTSVETPLGSSTAAHAVKARQYCVRYEGNSSKRWDGWEILLDGDWPESLYEPSELVPGKKLSLPWQGKRGHITHWRAIVIPAALTPSSGGAAKNVDGAISEGKGKKLYRL